MAVNMNLAYEYENYDMLDEHEEKYAEKIRRKRSANKRRKFAANMKIVIAAIIVLALFSIMTYGRVELSKSQLTTLQNENISLESELAQKTGLTKVEDFAENQLGLQKLDKSQIEYVEIDEKTTAEVVTPEDSNIFVKIKDWFKGALEYLGL